MDLLSDECHVVVGSVSRESGIEPDFSERWLVE